MVVVMVTLVAQAVLTNPLVPLLWRKEFVSGPLILDTLAAAYLPLALVFALAAWKLDHLRRLPRQAFGLAGAGYGAWYLGLYGCAYSGLGPVVGLGIGATVRDLAPGGNGRGGADRGQGVSG